MLKRNKNIIIMIVFIIALLVTFTSCDDLLEETSNELKESTTCEHDWNNATCLLPQTCSKCGETKGLALGHDYRIKSETAATCTVDGNETLLCSRCESVKEEIIASTGHKWKDATCTSPKICTVCNAIDGEPLGHIGADGEIADGKKYGRDICKRCGDYIVPYHDSGMYIVGQDIDAGVYYVRTQSATCYIEIASDSSGTFQSIIANENIQNYGYVVLHDGEYFKIRNGLFVEIDKAPTAQLLAGVYPAGMYKIGRDIPAGEYYINNRSSSAYFEVATDCSHLLKDIVYNDNISSFAYVTVHDGEYLTIKNSYFIPAESHKKPEPANNQLGEGMYKVGVDIPAGEYQISSNSDRRAYYEVATNSRHVLDSIIANENFTGTMYITVQEEQYLTITGGYIVIQ